MAEEGAGAAAAVPGDAGEAQASWTDSLGEDARVFVAGKGWKEPSEAIASYRALEQHVGVPADRLVKLPVDPESKEEWDQVYTRLGRPEKPDDYEFPETEPVNGVDLAQHFRGWAHELGLNKRQATDLFGRYQGLVQQTQEAAEQQYKEHVQTQDRELRSEWGLAYEENLQDAKRFGRTFGLSEDWLAELESVPGVDYKGLLKGAAKIGRALREHGTPEGDRETGQFGLTPEGAKAQIGKLLGDEAFMKVYRDGEGEAHKEAVRRMEELHRRAYPG